MWKERKNRTSSFSRRSKERIFLGHIGWIQNVKHDFPSFFFFNFTKPMEKLKLKSPIIGTARATTSPINIVTQLPLNGTEVARIITCLVGGKTKKGWRSEKFASFSHPIVRFEIKKLNYIDLKHRVVVVLEQNLEVRRKKNQCACCSVFVHSFSHCVSDENHSSIVACGWHLSSAGNICPSHESVNPLSPNQMTNVTNKRQWRREN